MLHCFVLPSARLKLERLNAGFLTEMEKATAVSRHHLILKVLKNETSAAEAVLGPSPGRNGTPCSKEERALFRAALETRRDDHWESIRKTAPMLVSTNGFHPPLTIRFFRFLHTSTYCGANITPHVS